MIKLNPYLNFLGNTEEAFNFYKSVFGGEFMMVQRFKDIPDSPDKEKISKADLDKLMHVSLMVGDNVLMGTDAIPSQGGEFVKGNNISLSLSVDSKGEADRVFAALSEGGKVEMPMQDMFWDSYFGMVDDKFGVKWMVSCDKKS